MRGEGLLEPDAAKTAQAVKPSAARRRAKLDPHDPPTALAPLEFTQVAFAGHARPGDLGDPQRALDGLRTAFRMLVDAGVVRSRLLTGVAPGADLLAIQAWRDVGMGEIHAVSPFLAPQYEIVPPELVPTATWLDGETTSSQGRNPHLAQTRWLIGAADLLVTVWTGDAARGPGGTADAVRLALEHGTPVLWVEPGQTAKLRLIRPDFLDEDFGFLELLEQLESEQEPLVTPATPQVLHAALADLGLEDTHDTTASGPAEAARPPAWRTYALFRRLLGGPQLHVVRHPPPADLAGQPGFASLTAARSAAAEAARSLGAMHRSQQVILLGLAILAAAAGSAPALWPNLKTTMVGTELLLALMALIVWLAAGRGERHLRWGDARKLAEDVRLERVAWTLGLSTFPHGATTTTCDAARRARRLAGLPRGHFDEARVQAWGAWVTEELLTGQVAYHRDQAMLSGRISRRIQRMGNVSFAVLLAVLVGYLAAAFLLTLAGDVVPRWLAGVVVMTGAIVPAIGAAGLALEATLSLAEQSRRSRALANRLEILNEELKPHDTLEKLQSVARTAIRLQRAQEDHWSEQVGRRRLFRGG